MVRMLLLRLVLIIRYSVIFSEIILDVVRVVVSSMVVRLEQEIMVNNVLVSVLSMMLLVRLENSILMFLVWVIGLVVVMISWSVRMIRLRLMNIWLSWLRWVCLWLRKKIMLKKISNGESYDRLRVSICVISVVLILVLSMIVRVGVSVIRFWVMKEVVSRVVVLLFCIRVVMLMLVVNVSGCFFML